MWSHRRELGFGLFVFLNNPLFYPGVKYLVLCYLWGGTRRPNPNGARLYLKHRIGEIRMGTFAALTELPSISLT